MRRAYLGLGANIGDAARTITEALAAVAELGDVAAVSPLYESDPVGGVAQDNFRNAVAALDTALAPLPLLLALHEIEGRFGRVRTTRGGPRTLDLDLLWYEGVQQDDPRLTLPHPRAHVREFVLRPLADIAPELPLAGSTVAGLLDRLEPQGVRPAPERLMGS